MPGLVVPAEEGGTVMTAEDERLHSINIGVGDGVVGRTAGGGGIFRGSHHAVAPPCTTPDEQDERVVQVLEIFPHLDDEVVRQALARNLWNVAAAASELSDDLAGRG
eukprot:TRINITY_DN6122_c0_g1_i2.p4 TRINITY_DN6122_c0_g1~~TRINITY_DN6122_c0_g1_i2.p4  ORF type:complete len:107 (-),score=32.56 TRINITY_DN6122_c0_g1_i2:93-413(-)